MNRVEIVYHKPVFNDGFSFWDSEVTHEIIDDVVAHQVNHDVVQIIRANGIQEVFRFEYLRIVPDEETQEKWLAQSNPNVPETVDPA